MNVKKLILKVFLCMEKCCIEIVYHYSKNFFLKLFRDAVSIISPSSYMFQGFAVRDLMTTSSISYTVHISLSGVSDSECEAEYLRKKTGFNCKKEKNPGRKKSVT
jgi:hypothetical protein